MHAESPSSTSMPSSNNNSGQTGCSDCETVAPLTSLLSVSKTVLLQAVDLLDNYLTSDDQLTVNSKFLPGSTIGKHLRHARDHFVLLVESVSSPPPHILSYDTRCRNTPMEGSRSAARAALVEAIDQLEARVPLTRMDAPMTLHATSLAKSEQLWFAGLHCVHHWSMVRVIAGELNIQLTGDFGFAPSTLVYQDRQGPLGKAKI
ncbi:hypothetical protein FPV67DRAFT_1464963 [Lyophyllum atratum]|nr:hypothetical protein FPV67DRAFT_1464963 [Lyophyllum atratum]